MQRLSLRINATAEVLAITFAFGIAPAIAAGSLGASGILASRFTVIGAPNPVAESGEQPTPPYGRKGELNDGPRRHRTLR